MPAQCLEDLDAYCACGLVALLNSRGLRRPVAPTRRMTVEVLATLQARGIIALPWPQAQWELPPRGSLAPVEQLSWDYIWPEVLLGGLADEIELALAQRPRDEISEAQYIVVWRELIRAESAEYFQFQLAKHSMDPGWFTDLDCLPRSYLDELSLTRWKYLIWSAVRHGAMHCMGSGFDAVQTREAVAATLASGQRLGYAQRGNFDGFLPKTPHAHSLMAGAFLRATQLGFSYWTEAPGLDGWKRHERRKAIPD